MERAEPAIMVMAGVDVVGVEVLHLLFGDLADLLSA